MHSYPQGPLNIAHRLVQAWTQQPADDFKKAARRRFLERIAHLDFAHHQIGPVRLLLRQTLAATLTFILAASSLYRAVSLI